MRPPRPLPVDLPEPKLNQEFVEALKIKESVGGWTSSVDPIDRLVRCHGHTLHDIWHLREGTFTRIPDIVIWPGKYFSLSLKYTKICQHLFFIYLLFYLFYLYSKRTYP